MRSRLLPLLPLLLVAPPGVTQTITFPVTASFSAGSPEVVQFTDVLPGTAHSMGSRVTNPIPAAALAPGGGTPLYSLADLGLTSFTGWDLLDIDAMTNARDTFDAASVLLSGDRVIDVEFTLEATGGGAPGTDAIVLAEYDTVSGNGAASDTFLARFYNGGRTLYEHATDALGVSPRAGGVPSTETNLDALFHGTTPIYPLYFSVSASTANVIGVSPADILVCNEPGQVPEIYIEHFRLGLSAGDDINALSIRRDLESGLWEVVFSLSKHSPIVSGSPPPYPIVLTTQISPAPIQPGIMTPSSMAASVSPVGSAGLIFARFEPSPGPGWTTQPFATPADLGLGWASSVPNPDDVAGVRIHDPKLEVPEYEPEEGGHEEKGSGIGSGPGPGPGSGSGSPHPSADADAFVLAADVASILVNRSVGGRDQCLELAPKSEFLLELRVPDSAVGQVQYGIFLTPGTLFDATASLHFLNQPSYIDSTSILFATNSAALQSIYGPPLYPGSPSLPYELKLPTFPLPSHAPVILQAYVGYLDQLSVYQVRVTNAIELEQGPWF